MAQSRNWKAYYSGDFTGYDLTVEGEVQAHKTLDVEPGLREADSPAINPTFFHVQLVNASDGKYKNVKEVFRVLTNDITTVVVFNEDGKEEASIPVTSKEKGGTFSDAFSDEFQ